MNEDTLRVKLILAGWETITTASKGIRWLPPMEYTEYGKGYSFKEACEIEEAREDVTTTTNSVSTFKESGYEGESTPVRSP